MSLSPGLWTSEGRSHIPFDSVSSIVHAHRRCWNISFLGTVIVYGWQLEEPSSEPHHSCVASKQRLHSPLPGLSPSYSAWFPHLRENGHPISLAPPPFCPFTGASQIHLVSVAVFCLHTILTVCVPLHVSPLIPQQLYPSTWLFPNWSQTLHFRFWSVEPPCQLQTSLIIRSIYLSWKRSSKRWNEKSKNL